jgi:type VI secretion system ImpM family protein
VTTELAVMGKLPTRGDFLRVNVVEPDVRALDRWMEEAQGHLAVASLAFPPSMKVLWPGEQGWVLAAFVPSRDSVGRSYPLGAATQMTSPTSPPILAVAADAVLSGFVDWLSAAERVGEGPLLDGLGRVASTPLDLFGAQRLCHQVATTEPVADVEGRLFDTPDGRDYAYRTLCIAVDAIASGQRLALDCPLAIDVDQFFWLSLVGELAPGAPTVMWVEEPTPRMLIGFGSLPPTALRALAGRPEDPAWHWPLTTPRDAARRAASAAMQAMPPMAGESLGAFASRLGNAFRGGAHRAS